MAIKRVLLIILVIVLGFLLIDGAVRIAGFYSAISTGLTMHTSPVNARLTAPAEVSFEYTALSPALCAATCEARLVRHDPNEVIATSDLGVLSSSTISARIEAESSLKRVPVQLLLTCETRQTRYCAYNEQFTSDLAIVSFELNEEHARIRESIIENQNAIEDRISNEKAMLEALSELEAPYETIANEARNARDEYAQSIRDFLEATRREDYREPPQTPLVLESWNEQHEALSEANEQSDRTAHRLTTLKPYRESYRDDGAGFDEIIRAYTTLNETPTRSISVLEGINEQLDRLEAAWTNTILTLAYERARRTHDQYRAACTIYQTPCPEPIEEPETISEAHTLTTETCTLARDYRIAEQKEVIAQRLNLTLEDAFEAYNTSSLRATPGFADFETSAIENATQGPVNLTIAERLAISVPVNANCDEPVRTTRITIPELALTKEPITITIPSERTCALGECEHESRAPLVFIHGHSFAESTDPRYNLQGMTRLAHAFEEHGYLYAGHLFPNTAREIGRIDAPVSFTATYYVNSYEEEGEILVRTFKSEPVESYALRLREDIDEARRLTGSDTVVLVAHSMGGLVARSYLDLFGTAHVERLVMIGTPNHGIIERTQQLCPLLGASLECRDMNQGSIFLRRLNNKPLPDIPMRVIAGTGCEEGDGVVTLENALLVGANTTIITGTCSGLDTLHGHLIDPRRYPDVVETIASDLR